MKNQNNQNDSQGNRNLQNQDLHTFIDNQRNYSTETSEDDPFQDDGLNDTNYQVNDYSRNENIPNAPSITNSDKQITNDKDSEPLEEDLEDNDNRDDKNDPDNNDNPNDHKDLYEVSYDPFPGTNPAKIKKN